MQETVCNTTMLQISNVPAKLVKDLQKTRATSSSFRFFVGMRIYPVLCSSHQQHDVGGNDEELSFGSVIARATSKAWESLYQENCWILKIRKKTISMSASTVSKVSHLMYNRAYCFRSINSTIEFQKLYKVMFG